MKNSILNLALGIFAISFLAFTHPTSLIESYKVDAAKSQVNWKGYKVTGEHAGTIAIKNGGLDFSEGKLIGGSFDIDMTQIQVTDLEGEYKDKLEGHLSSPDFFGVEKYPTASFKITQVIDRGTPGDYKIVGDLKIKETTKSIKFLTNVTEVNGIASAKADLTIDRSDFDIRYGSGSFFDNLGDKTIYDEFELSIELVAGR